MGKRQSFLQMVLGRLEGHTQKNEAGPLPDATDKTRSGWIKDISMSAATLKLFSEKKM